MNQVLFSTKFINSKIILNVLINFGKQMDCKNSFLIF